MNTLITATLALLDETFTVPLKLMQRTGMTFLVRLLLLKLPYYMKFWRHVNLAILKNPYLATL